jgi:TPR repeat protein
MKRQGLIIWGMSILALLCGLLLAGCGSAPPGAAPASSADEPKDAGAQFNLGVRYYNGEGVAKDLEKAAYWYTKAAEQGPRRPKRPWRICESDSYRMWNKRP